MTIHSIPALIQMAEDSRPEATRGVIQKIQPRFKCGKNPDGTYKSTMQRAELHGEDAMVIALRSR